jgi:DNA-binding GntR family transcriptional regulator
MFFVMQYDTTRREGSTMSDASFALELDEIKNVSTLVSDRLSDAIQRGVLKPGEHLVQGDLAEQFGVSRVAIRDALYLLKQRGLAIDVPRKGTVVRSISCQTVRDLFAVRRAVEGLAGRDACRTISEETLDRLEQLINEQEVLAHGDDLSPVLDKDWEWHQLIYCQSDNEPLQEFIAVLWSRTKQARSLARGKLDWGKAWGLHSAARHREILQALRRRDPDEVERLIAHTIAAAEEELVQGLQDAGWGDPQAV